MIKEILKKEGFEEITKMPSKNLFDYIATKKGKRCFIKFKYRTETAKTQTFSISYSKLKRLKELKNSDDVYLLFINKFGHQLIEIDDFLTTGTDKKFKVYLFERKGKKRIKALKIDNEEVPQIDKLLPPRVVAPMLGISTKTLWEWTTKKGKIKAERTTTGRLLYRESEVKRIQKIMFEYSIPSLRGIV